MKKIFTQPLVEDLGFELRQQLALLSRLQSLDPACLLEQPTPGAWSAIQILEHLNSYSRFYLPKLHKRGSANNLKDYLMNQNQNGGSICPSLY